MYSKSYRPKLSQVFTKVVGENHITTPHPQLLYAYIYKQHFVSFIYSRNPFKHQRMNGMDVPNPLYRDRDHDDEGREMNAHFDLEDHVCHFSVLNTANPGRLILTPAIWGLI